MDVIGLLPWNTHILRIDIFIQSFLKCVIKRGPQAGAGKRAGRRREASQAFTFKPSDN